jgi:hypothetical protein
VFEKQVPVTSPTYPVPTMVNRIATLSSFVVFLIREGLVRPFPVGCSLELPPKAGRSLAAGSGVETNPPSGEA